MDLLTDSPMLLVYLGVLLGPFIQEDAAVVAAASLSVTNAADTTLLFIIITIGLFLSDIWKYWIGWAAMKNKGGQAFAQKKQVANLKDKVIQYPLVTLITGRFVPFTRIPIYVACGFFGVSYLKFCFYIAFTAVLYVAVIFALFHALGTLVGERIIWVLPAIVICVFLGFLGWHFLKRRKNQPEAE